MISYKPLRILMTKADVNGTILRKKLSIGTNTIAKINQDDGYVALEVLDKIVSYLSVKLDKKIEANEILEFISDETDPAGYGQSKFEE